MPNVIPFKLALPASFVSSKEGLARVPRACNAIDDLLPLTLIKMEHVQEIKLSLSFCNEILSIMILFTSQSDKNDQIEAQSGPHALPPL